MVVAWILTLPTAAAIGAGIYAFTQIFGDGVAGPIIVAILGVASLAMASPAATRRRPPRRDRES